MARKKRTTTKTQRAINNINTYINKVAITFGTHSQLYEDITNKVLDAGLTWYENKKGFMNIQNSKTNRQLHQKIRSINQNKPSFARAKKRLMKEIEALEQAERDYWAQFDEPDIPDIGIDTPVPEIPEEPAIPEPVPLPPPKETPFGEWYKNWKNDWSNKEQYEIRDKAEELGVPFDYEQWYSDYGYRERIKMELYEKEMQNIIEEYNRAANAAGQTLDPVSGEVLTYNSNQFKL